MIKLKVNLLLLFLSILLIGCGKSTKIIKVPTPVKEIVEVKKEIPKDKLNCKDLPKETDLSTLEKMSFFLTDLWDVAIDCKSKLSDINKIINKKGE